MELLIGDVFRNAARAVPGRVAVALGDDQLTFADVDRRANRVARALAGLGIGPRDRVVTWAGTTLDAVPVFAGLAKGGLVFAPVNGLLSPSEAADMASAARPALLVVDAEREEPAEEVATKLGVPVLSMAGLGTDRVPDRPAAVPRLTELVGSVDDADVRPAGLSEHDTHVLFFTSGSTGRSKGVVLSHRVNALRTHPGSQLEPRGALVCPFPLFHMGAWTQALQQFQARDRVVFVERADAEIICDAIGQHRAARIMAIPGVWQRILDHLASPAGRQVDLSSLRWADSGTSATPLDLLERIMAAVPDANVRIFYGSTEAGNVASLDHADIRTRPGSCGQPSHWAEIRVDEAGELWVRGPLLFDGYYENTEATAEALVDGWYRTGDVVTVDDDGYLSVIGRARDVVRTGGETVGPAEVEGVLATCPGVADVAVVGLPDVRWGEVICAVVVPADPAQPPTLDDLRAHCDGRLAGFKRPRELRVVDHIPRTASTNQVQRRLIVERLQLPG